MFAKPEIEVGSGVSTAEFAFDAAVEAARMALSDIEIGPPSVVFVYASVSYELSEVLRGVSDVVGDAPIIGTTTAGEICNGRHSKSVVVAALSSPHLAVYGSVGQNVSADWASAVRQAVSSPNVSRFFEPTSEIWRQLTREGKSVFAFLIVPGNTRHHDAKAHEILEATKSESHGRFPVMGGAAADDWKMDGNSVFFGREPFPDTLLLAIFETRLQFGIALTHGFHPTASRASVTAVNAHEVLAINGLPAADELPRLLGSSRQALEGKHLSLTTGRALGIRDAMGQYSIVVSTFMTPQGACRLARPVTPGTELTVMEPHSETMIGAGGEALRKAMLRGGITDSAIALVSYCALRSRIMGDDASGKEIAGMREVMGGTPVIGFYSFGEGGVCDDGVSRYYNAAVSVLVIGKDLSPAARVALEAERLRVELEQKASELEERVAERTSELLASNTKLRHTQQFLDTIIENVPAMLFVKEATEHRLFL
jgi:hypothetical protein